jgi:antitoxin component of MazEF toxin-antitoxin module
MLIDGKRVNLSPGMNITAEIKTGQRRIIEFLLSPVQRAGSESLRERLIEKREEENHVETQTNEQGSIWGWEGMLDCKTP